MNPCSVVLRAGIAIMLTCLTGCMVKKFLLGFFTLLLPCAVWGADEAPRVLFLGNSYTSVNQLPKMFQEMVASTGAAKPEVKAWTPGGERLAGHLQEQGALKLIDEGKWDVVILQGQSQEAAWSEGREDIRADFLRGAGELCRRIRTGSPKAKIVFYQTWARHADYWKARDAGTDLGGNPEEMQERNRKLYRQAAVQNPGAVVAPVGDAWELHYRKPGAVRLHQADHSHPALDGTYLACLVLYGVSFQPARLEVPFRGGLAEARAASLQGVAAELLGPTATNQPTGATVSGGEAAH